MSNCLNAYGKSTNLGKSKNRLSLSNLLLIYLGIWISSILAFWIFTDDSNAMGYSLLVLWIALPVTTFVISLIIGKNNDMRNWKWVFSVVFGVLYMVAEYATFSLANMISFKKLNAPQYGMILAGTIISIAGMGIGSGIRDILKQKGLMYKPEDVKKP